VLATPGQGYSEKELMRMDKLALARIKSFPSEPDAGFGLGTEQPYEHAILDFTPKNEARYVQGAF